MRKYDANYTGSTEGMTLVACNQLVGDGRGYMRYRNLYEDSDGALYSVPTSGWIDCEQHKREQQKNNTQQSEAQ